MFQINISGKTPDELKANVAAWLGSASVAAIAAATESAPLSGTEQARLRADATVVPPKDDKAAKATAKKAEKAAAEQAEKEAAEQAAKAAAEAGDDDGLDDDGLGETEELTHEDVKKLLIEVRTAYPKKNTIVKEIVTEHGKAEKISEVDAKNLGAVAKRCRELLAAAK